MRRRARQNQKRHPPRNMRGRAGKLRMRTWAESQCSWMGFQIPMQNTLQTKMFTVVERTLFHRKGVSTLSPQQDQPKRGLKRPGLKRPAAAIATPTEVSHEPKQTGKASGWKTPPGLKHIIGWTCWKLVKQSCAQFHPRFTPNSFYIFSSPVSCRLALAACVSFIFSALWAKKLFCWEANKRGRPAVTLHTCQLCHTNDVGVKWAVYSYGKGCLTAKKKQPTKSTLKDNDPKPSAVLYYWGRQPTPKGQRCQRCAVFAPRPHPHFTTMVVSPFAWTSTLVTIDLSWMCVCV